MQLRTISRMVTVLLGLLLAATASCSQEGRTELTWRPVSANDLLIDVALPSGIEIKGTRYRKERLIKTWHLEITNTTGPIQSISKMTVHSTKGKMSNLSHQDFQELFAALISFIKKNNSGRLDEIHIGLGFITEIWEDTVSFLRKGAIPANYKLKSKDLNLAKKISSYLRTNSILKMLCNEVLQIKKVCKDNFVSMNPITFELNSIGKEWDEVKKLPNLGIPIDKLWFGISLSN